MILFVHQNKFRIYRTNGISIVLRLRLYTAIKYAFYRREYKYTLLGYN